MSEGPATITVASVEKKKEGVSNSGRPWTLWHIHAAEGTKYATFDGAVANTANMALGKRAFVTWDVSDKGGLDLKTFAVDPNQSADPPPATPAPVRDRDTNGNADWDLIGLRKTRCALWAGLFSSGVLAGMPESAALTLGVGLVRGAEEDIFHRSPAQKDDSIPF